MNKSGRLDTILTAHREVTVFSANEAKGRVFTPRLEMAGAVTRETGEDGVGDLGLGRDATRATRRRRKDTVTMRNRTRSRAPPGSRTNRATDRRPRRASGEEAGRTTP